MRCSRCDSIITRGMRTCVSCGHFLTEIDWTPEPPSPTIWRPKPIDGGSSKSDPLQHSLDSGTSHTVFSHKRMNKKWQSAKFSDPNGKTQPPKSTSRQVQQPRGWIEGEIVASTFRQNIVSFMEYKIHGDIVRSRGQKCGIRTQNSGVALQQCYYDFRLELIVQIDKYLSTNKHRTEDTPVKIEYLEFNSGPKFSLSFRWSPGSQNPWRAALRITRRAAANDIVPDSDLSKRQDHLSRREYPTWQACISDQFSAMFDIAAATSHRLEVQQISKRKLPKRVPASVTFFDDPDAIGAEKTLRPIADAFLENLVAQGWERTSAKGRHWYNLKIRHR